MIKVKRSSTRGRTNIGWLDSQHSFSFGDYYDPEQQGFRSLRVINEDKVAPGGGFPRHPHRDMEIISYVLDGALSHSDSLGTGSTIKVGDVQRMTAGAGIVHSEMNASKTEPVHFLQIWIVPERARIAPSYQQQAFGPPPVGADGKLALAAGPAGQGAAVEIHQDARLYAGKLAAGARAEHALAPGRYGWVQVARGEVVVNGQQLQAGDAAALSDEPHVSIEATAPAEVLLFDLA